MIDRLTHSRLIYSPVDNLLLFKSSLGPSQPVCLASHWAMLSEGLVNSEIPLVDVSVWQVCPCGISLLWEITPERESFCRVYEMLSFSLCFGWAFKAEKRLNIWRKNMYYKSGSYSDITITVTPSSCTQIWLRCLQTPPAPSYSDPSWPWSPW